MIQLLSKIPDRHLMTIEDVIDYCIDNGFTEVINDFGHGITVGLDELHLVWESKKNIKGWKEL